MLFVETPIEGVLLIDSEPSSDDRGSFTRLFCATTFRSRGLIDRFTQHSASFNLSKGTLRGLHFQRAPHAETKLVRCTRGAVYDVAVDLRPASPSFGRHVAAELSADNRRAFYIPAGCAHGFLTLEDQTELFYEMTPDFVPDASGGVAWNDPELAIPWPFDPLIVSERDRSLPSLLSLRHAAS